MFNVTYIKLEKSGEFFLFSVRNSQEKYRTNRHYIPRDDFFRAMFGEKYCDIDAGTSLRVQMRIANPYSVMDFTFLYHGQTYYYTLPLLEVVAFFNSNKEYQYFKPLEYRFRKPAKLKFSQYSLESLREILANPTVKNHFRRAIMNLVDNFHDEIDMYSDCKYSLCFVKKNHGRKSYNGGLIYHAPGIETFSVCLDSRPIKRRNPYSIHT